MFANFLVATIIFATLLVASQSFSPALNARYRLSPSIEMSAFSDAMQSKFTKAVTIAVVSNALVLSPMNVFTPVQSAHADVRAQQKRTYFRFVPKLIIGRDFYKDQIKTAIDKEDWPVITKFFDEFVTKYNPNDPSQVDSTDKYVNINLYRPMTVFSGSFAERGSSPKQKALMDQEVAFEKAMKGLEGCVKDMKGEGFFAADIKMPTGAEKKKQALAAYAEGKAALNEYIRLADDGLMLELNKIDQI